MREVLLTAIGVGAATVFGALLGFIFKNISHNTYFQTYCLVSTVLKEIKWKVHYLCNRGILPAPHSDG